MRIGMILDNPFPPDPRVENEAVTLIEAGHEVYLYCLDFERDKEPLEVVDKIIVNRHRVSRIMDSLSALAYTTKTYHNNLRDSIRTFLNRNQIEAIHIHDMRVARAVFDANSNIELPVVLDLHENRPEIMKYYHHVNTFWGKTLIDPTKWRHYEKRYIQAADRVLVVTDEAKQYYLSRMQVEENKFAVVPNTVRQEFFQDTKVDPAITEAYRDRFVALYWGDTGTRRGIETALDAVPFVRHEIPHFQLLIAGRSKSDNAIKAKIKRDGLQEHAEHVGWQHYSLFKSFICASHLGLCPFHRNIHHDTTFANKLFKYLSLGRPVVVSDCPSQARIVRDYECGHVFRDRDPLHLAQQILKLYRNKTSYEIMSNNARAAITDHLNWRCTSKPLIEAYDQFSANGI